MNKIQPDITLPREPKIKIYRALLTQTGTNAPTALVLQNTLGGTPIWTRLDVGRYQATLAVKFPSGSIGLLTSSTIGITIGQLKYPANDSDHTGIGTYQSGTGWVDDALTKQYIEIIVTDNL